MIARLATLVSLAMTTVALAQTAATQPALPDVGGDVSMLPSLERFGAVYNDASGQPADAIKLLRDAGWRTFRVRLFVDPSSDFDKSWGATQSLDNVRTLSKRIIAAGGDVMLDIHYSDTWADPEHQAKPKAWASLSGDALEKRVHDYTTEVLKALHDDGVTPALVQVGNEITAGILWPDGKLDWDRTTPEQAAAFVKLMTAGCRAVREASPTSRIVIHAHGGGKVDLRSFYERLRGVDYDVIGLSFYPAYGESLDYLRKQIGVLRTTFGKDVIIAETSYPREPIDIEAKYRNALMWPATTDGQRTFAHELHEVVRDAGGIGIQWWYPEATPVAGHAIYHGGGEGLFDEKTHQLAPAAAALAR